MQIPEPRLNKTPFYSAAGVAFTAALLIGLLAENKFDPLPFLTAVCLLILSIAAIMIPAFADYAANERESTARVRGEMEDQIVRLQLANESLVRAAAHIKATEEAVHKSAREAETLPYRMQEKLAEFNDALAASEESDREALERELEELRSLQSAQLKAAAEKIHKATAEWSALEATTRKHLAAAQELAGKIERRLSAARIETMGVESSTAEPAAKESSVTAPPFALPPTNGHPIVLDARSTPDTNGSAAPAAPKHEEFSLPAAAPFASAPVEASAPVSPVAAAPAEPSAPTSSEPVKVKKPRAPRKPRPEETLLAMSDTPAAAETVVAEPIAMETSREEPTVAISQDETGETAAKPESSTSSDGATRLLATAYIGIGNKLFIRGDGPGLSWDRGVPMQFVSIGKWGWATHDATRSVRIKLYKNDDTAALSGDLTLEPGRHTEVSALF